MIRKLSSGKYRLYSRKQDPKTGKFVDVYADPEPFKGVRKSKAV